MTIYSGDFKISFTVPKESLGDALIALNPHKWVKDLGVTPIELAGDEKPQKAAALIKKVPKGKTTPDLVLGLMKECGGVICRSDAKSFLAGYGYTDSGANYALETLSKKGAITKEVVEGKLTYRIKQDDDENRKHPDDAKPDDSGL